MNPRQVMYAEVCAMDNQDVPAEDYPDRLVDALARAGFAVVPVALPFEVLGEAAMRGVSETGNPKHCWDYLLQRVRVGPNVLVTGQPLAGPVDQRVSALVEKRDDA